MPQHPFTWISESARVLVFIVSTVLAVLIMLALQVLGAPMKTDAAPAGIISYELAGNYERAALMVQSWRTSAMAAAGLNIGLDYLFLVSYALAIGLVCVLLANRGFVPSLGRLFAWGLILAASLDAVENFGLIQTLLGSTRDLWPVLAKWCAIPKFFLVLLGLLYALAGGIWTVIYKSTKGEHDHGI